MIWTINRAAGLYTRVHPTVTPANLTTAGNIAALYQNGRQLGSMVIRRRRDLERELQEICRGLLVPAHRLYICDLCWAETNKAVYLSPYLLCDRCFKIEWARKEGDQ